MNVFNTTVVKYFFGIVGLALLGVAGSYAISVYQYAKSPEYRAEQDLKARERRYAEDTYGGSTPEETLELFIAALKKEDIDLAVRYFIIDKQEEWRGNLQRAKSQKLFSDMIHDLERKRYKYETSEQLVSFDIANDNNEVALSISVARIPNGIWKIVDM